MARTNIDIDDVLIDAVMMRYGLSTKREAVDHALRHLAGQPTTTAEARELFGAFPDFASPTDPPARDPHR